MSVHLSPPTLGRQRIGIPWMHVRRSGVHWKSAHTYTVPRLHGQLAPTGLPQWLDLHAQRKLGASTKARRQGDARRDGLTRQESRPPPLWRPLLLLIVVVVVVGHSWHLHCAIFWVSHGVSEAEDG